MLVLGTKMLIRIGTLIVIALALGTPQCQARKGSLSFLGSDLATFDPEIWNYVDEFGDQEFIRVNIIGTTISTRLQVRRLREYAVGLAAQRGDQDLLNHWLAEPRPGMQAGYGIAVIAASRSGHWDIVHDLITHHGVDPTVMDNEAFVQAAIHNHAQILELLVEHNANVHAQNDRALRESVQVGLSNVVEFILDLVQNSEDIPAFNRQLLDTLIAEAMSLRSNPPQGRTARDYTQIITRLRRYVHDIYEPVSHDPEDSAKRRRGAVI